MYKKGSYIIKNLNGVCKVEDIVQLEGAGMDKNKKYYYLRPVNEHSGKLYVSVDNAENLTRRVMTEEEVWQLIDQIPEIEEIWIDNEKLRELRYKEALKSRDPRMLVGIIKMLYLRRKKRMEQGKKSTSTDEKYFKMAEDILYSEIGFVLGKEKKEVGELITEFINKKAMEGQV